MAASRRIQQLKSYDQSDEDDCPGDYLQDASLWTDQLPQPFKMIDKLLHQLLLTSWDVIDRREEERKREAAKVRIPEISEWSKVTELEDLARVDRDKRVLSLRASKDGRLVFVRGSHEFNVLRAPALREGERAATSKSFEMNLNQLDVVLSRDIHFCAALFNREIKIFAFTNDKLISITSILSSSEEVEFVSCQFSQVCSHLGVSVSHREAGVSLQIHLLPLDSWHSDLKQYMDKLATAMANATEDHQKQTSVQEMVYSKPSLLAVIRPPKGFAPCPTNDPGEALKRVKEGMRDHLPTGECHTLTPKYFEGRKKAFIDVYPQMADSYDEILETLEYSKSLPSYHFLHYKDKCMRAKPCYMAVWWERHTQLFIYTLPKEVSKNPGSATQNIYWLIPHASNIILTAVSADTRLLAVGQARGVVSVYNLENELDVKVMMVTQSPDRITCMEFFGSVIGVGTQDGKVVGISTKQERKISDISLKERLTSRPKQWSDSQQRNIFESSGYEVDSRVVGLRVSAAMPSVLSSVHANGSVILWSIDDGKALCKLCLPSDALSEQCLYTNDGKTLLTPMATDEGDASCLISFDLCGSSTRQLLSKHLKEEDEKDGDPLQDLKEDLCTGNIMEVVERELQKYLNQRAAKREVREARFEKTWAYFDELLKAQK